MAGVPILGPAQNQQSAGVGARDTGMGPDAVGCMIGSLASFPDKKLPLVAEGLVKGFPGSRGVVIATCWCRRASRCRGVWCFPMSALKPARSWWISASYYK